MQLDVTGDSEIVADFAEKPQVVTKALVRALNRSIGSGRTLMARLIAQDTGLKNADVKAALRMNEATFSRTEASLGASLKRIPLIQFNARGPEPSRGRGGGVTYRLRGGRGRISSGFIATMDSGHRGVFARVPGKFMRSKPKRQAIDEKMGPSLGHVFRKHREAGVQKVVEVFDKNFAHELGFQKSLRDAGTD